MLQLYLLENCEEPIGQIELPSSGITGGLFWKWGSRAEQCAGASLWFGFDSWVVHLFFGCHFDAYWKSRQLRHIGLNQLAWLCIWTESLLLQKETIRKRERPPPPPPSPPPPLCWTSILAEGAGLNTSSDWSEPSTLYGRKPEAVLPASAALWLSAVVFSSQAHSARLPIWIYGCIMFAIMTYGLPRVASICWRTRGGRCSPPSWTGCCEQHHVDKWATKGSRTVHVVEPVGPVVADGRSRQCVGWAEHPQWDHCQDSLTQLNRLCVEPSRFLLFYHCLSLRFFMFCPANLQISWSWELILLLLLLLL